MALIRSLSFVLALLLISPAAQAAPKADLWERWTAHDASSTQTIDHGAWDAFLAEYLSLPEDRVARLDYAGVSAADRAALEAYVETLSATAISTHNRQEQYAYWLNFYNALTVKVILDHFPVESIMDISISPGLFSRGPWGKKLVTIEGEEVSLDDMEHRILRPIWKDARIHYGVNCASIGCPNLAPQAFTPANLEAQLEAGAKAYVNHPRGVTVKDGDVTVSSIYDWFQEDFDGTEAGVIKHLVQYAEPALKSQLEGKTGYDDDTYDWALNSPVKSGS